MFLRIGLMALVIGGNSLQANNPEISGLNADQASSILTLLSSFGADQTIRENVKHVFNGETVGEVTQSGLSKAMVDSILSLLSTFGAYQELINNIKNVLIPAPTPAPPTIPDPPETERGWVTVSSTVQLANSLAPENAARLPFTRFILTAKSIDTTIDNITIQRFGAIDSTLFNSIILLDQDGLQIGDSSALDEGGKTKLGTSFTVPANTSRVYTIAVNMQSDLDAYAGQVGGIAVIGINTSATVAGTLPITGSQHTVNATLSLGAFNSPANGTLVSSADDSLDVGTVNKVFTSVKWSAAGEDMYLKSIRWEQTGSASNVEDLANVVTLVDGVVYPTVINGDYFTTVFPGNGILTLRGRNKEVSVRGDVVNGSTRTIRFDIQKQSDVHVVGKTFGYGALPAFGSDTDNDNDARFRSTNDPYFDAYSHTISAGTISEPEPVPPTTPAPPTIPDPTETERGGITVSTTKQPAASLAPRNTARILFTNFILTAGQNDVTVDSISVMKTGLVDLRAFESVMLLDRDGLQIGRSSVLDSNGIATIGIPFVIPTGHSQVYTVAVNTPTDTALYAGQVGGISVININTSATVSGSLPIIGASHTINHTLIVGTVSKIERGTFESENNQAKRIGTTGYNFSSVVITPAVERLRSKSIRWKQTGSANSSDISNIVTVVRGVLYPTIQSGNYYTTIFPGDGLFMLKGFTTTISVRGDIVGGSEKTIDFDIDAWEDIHLVGDVFGFGVRLPFGSTSDNNDAGVVRSSNYPYYDAHQVTILPAVGTISVTADPEIPAQNISVGVMDQILGGFIVEVTNEPISLSRIAMAINIITQDGSSVSMADLTSVKIVDENDTVIAGPVDGTGLEKYGSLLFTDSVTFHPGVTYIRLIGKLSANFGLDDTIQVSTIPSTFWLNVRGETTGWFILPTPNTVEQSSWMTAKTASLRISVSSGSSSDTAVAGASQFPFVSIVFDATRSGDDIRITSIPLTFGAKGIYGSDITNCRLHDGATAVTSPAINPVFISGESHTFTFDGNGLTILKGTVRTLDLRCNVSSSVTSGLAMWSIDESLADSNQINAFGIVSSQLADITIQAEEARFIRLTSSGGYTVRNDVSLLHQEVPAGTSDVTLARLQFNASVAENIAIKQIALRLGEGSSDSSSVLADENVTLWIGNTQIGTAQFGLANPDFAVSTLHNPFTLPKGEQVTVTVKGDLLEQYIGTDTSKTLFIINYDGENSGVNGNYGVGVYSGAIVPDSTQGEVTTNGISILYETPVTDSTPTPTEPDPTTMDPEQTHHDGTDGKIILSIKLIGDKIFQLNLITRSDGNYEIQSSCNLFDWGKIFSVSTGPEPMDTQWIIDAKKLPGKCQFFRVISLP